MFVKCFTPLENVLFWLSIPRRNGTPTHVKLSKIKGGDDYSWVRKIHVVSAKVVSLMRISDSLDEHMTFMTRMKPLI